MSNIMYHHNSQHMHTYNNSPMGTFIYNSSIKDIHIIGHSIKIIHNDKPFGKLTVLPRIFIFTPKANSKQKHVKTTQEHEKGALLLGDSSWRGDLLAVASKHCSLPHSRSMWQTDGEQTVLPVTL